MPELPDVEIYREALQRYLLGRRLEKLRLVSPFVLRSVDPPAEVLEGLEVVGIRRIGKRLVLGFEGDLFLVVHLMIAGRLRWRARGAKPPGRRGLAAFDFPDGTLLFTEEGSKKRASLHVVRGVSGLAEHDRGGLEVLDCDAPQFVEALLRENRTLKRALTDPRLFSGIGNAYSDEILHRARLSPARLTRQLADDEVARLQKAARLTLVEWTDRLRAQTGEGFPQNVTAFREGMTVHGRYGQPCPACASPVQRIRYANNEANYCARCQTGGRLLADRSLSRLLKKDWPRTLEELEQRRASNTSRSG
jgi:formamidopyrimidine-DNA glycosylase